MQKVAIDIIVKRPNLNKYFSVQEINFDNQSDWKVVFWEITF